VSKTSQSKTKIAAPNVPGWAQGLGLFGPPLLLEGEDAAAHDQLLARICAVINPIDIVDEMFIAELVFLEWEVLRWRRLKWSLPRAHGLEALERFLAGQLDYDLYSEQFADDLAEILQDNLPEDQMDSAPALADKCARNEADAVDKVNNILDGSGQHMNDILGHARANKAKELVKEYEKTRLDERAQDQGQPRERAPAPDRKPSRAALARRETRFATR